MTALPIARQHLSLGLAAAIVAMPAILCGLHIFVFRFLYPDTHPPKTVQHMTFVMMFALEWCAYALGMFRIHRLNRHSPAPATSFGYWFTRIICGSFAMLAGLWCALISLVVAAMTFFWN